MQHLKFWEWAWGWGYKFNLHQLLSFSVLPVFVAVIPLILDVIKDHAGIYIGIDNATDVSIRRINATEGPS